MQDYQQGSIEGWPNTITVYTDGASRGNPGDASLGIVYYDDQANELFCFGKYLGQQTNNVAEYTAVQVALEKAIENKIENLTLKSDSQLLVKQLMGEYKVKSAGLKPIYLQCIGLIKQIKNFHIEHVRREFNKRADEVANIVLDLM